MRGREEVLFGWQFRPQGVGRRQRYPAAPLKKTTRRSPATLKPCTAASSSTGRSTQTVEQNIRRQDRRLQLPVLAIGGADGLGEAVAATMRLVANDVTPVVLPHCGH